MCNAFSLFLSATITWRGLCCFWRKILPYYPKRCSSVWQCCQYPTGIFETWMIEPFSSGGSLCLGKTGPVHSTGNLHYVASKCKLCPCGSNMDLSPGLCTQVWGGQLSQFQTFLSSQIINLRFQVTEVNPGSMTEWLRDANMIKSWKMRHEGMSKEELEKFTYL